jgi:hypothetical protein
MKILGVCVCVYKRERERGKRERATERERKHVMILKPYSKPTVYHLIPADAYIHPQLSYCYLPATSQKCFWRLACLLLGTQLSGSVITVWSEEGGPRERGSERKKEKKKR